MNKQELIDKLNKQLTTPSEGTDFDYGHDYGIQRAIYLAEDLDEQQAPINKPEKPVVPQFVADWYDDNQDDFEMNLYNLCVDFHKRKLPDDLYEWFNKLIDKPIETFVKMKLFGYEVKKEKLYTVEIPNPNSAGGKLVLSKQQSTGSLILEMLNSDINKPKYLHLTEDEIKKDFGWAWQFAEEVEE